jgi:hypothetical protein
LLEKGRFICRWKKDGICIGKRKLYILEKGSYICRKTKDIWLGIKEALLLEKGRSIAENKKLYCWKGEDILL